MKNNKINNLIKKQNMKKSIKQNFWDQLWVREEMEYFYLRMLVCFVAIIIFIILLIVNKVSASENEQVKEGSKILSEMK
jgi:hypothetical protein